MSVSRQEKLFLSHYFEDLKHFFISPLLFYNICPIRNHNCRRENNIVHRMDCYNRKCSGRPACHPVKDCYHRKCSGLLATPWWTAIIEYVLACLPPLAGLLSLKMFWPACHPLLDCYYRKFSGLPVTLGWTAIIENVLACLPPLAGMLS